MKNITHRVVETNSYFETHAYALLSYADKNERFAWWLTEAILSYPFADDAFDWFSEEDADPFERRRTLCEPTEEYTAMQRAQWLLSSLATSSTYDAPEVMSILSMWAEARETRKPRHLIIGIVGLAIPGPTLGDIAKKKKNTLPILIATKAHTKKPKLIKNTYEIAHTLSLDILEQSIRNAEGNAYHLEPEVADWFFSDKKYILYSGDARAFSKMHKEANQQNLPYSLRKDTAGNQLLALSPSVDLSVYTSFTKVEE